jgi:ER membrane protein complex subunit 6
MTASEDEDEVFESKIIGEAMQKNIKTIGDYETIMFIAAGCIAGILGFTNLHGLFFFLFTSIVVTFSLSLKLRFKIYEYTNSSVLNVWIQGLSNHALSFVLFWTLAYALVYIY